MPVTRLEQGVWVSQVGLVEFAFYGDLLSADWTSHVVFEVPLGYFEADTSDHGFVAVRTERVF